MTSSSTLRLVHQGGPLAAAAVAVGFGCSDVGAKKNAVLLHSPSCSILDTGPISRNSKDELYGRDLKDAKRWGLRRGWTDWYAAASCPSCSEQAVDCLTRNADPVRRLQSPLSWDFSHSTVSRLPPFLDLRSGSLALPWPLPPLSSRACITSLDRSSKPAPATWFSDQRRALSHQEASTSSSGPSLAAGYGSQAPVHSFHSWHLPVPGSFSAEADAEGRPSEGTPLKAPLVVVVLGWLGSKQKHLKKYADWYTEQGIHCVTFTIPMSSVLSVGKGGKAESHIDELVEEIKHWVGQISATPTGAAEGPAEHALVFHTFSNTGWLTYGAVLEKLHKEGSPLLANIRGCVVDSAPVANPDPQVWASGFTVALLGKRSSAVKYDDPVPRPAQGAPVGSPEPLPTTQPHSSIREAFLHSALERFFSVFLQLPLIRKRLAEVTRILAEKQPATPQLYIYSSADKVIPVRYVEQFIEQQKQQGRSVWSKDMEHSPHVDHFRANPAAYTQHLKEFLEKCVPQGAPKSQGGKGTEQAVTEV